MWNAGCGVKDDADIEDDILQALGQIPQL